MFALILIGIVTFLLFVYFRSKYSYWEKRGIKGPRPIPFLGTILSETSLPPKELEEKYLKEYGQVFGTYAGTTPILNTSNVDHIKQVFGDLRTFPNENSSFEFHDKYLAKSMVFRNGLDWKTTRAAQTHYFTSKKFKSLMGHFEAVTSNFLKNLERIRKETKSDEFEIRKLSRHYSMDVIAKVLFAIDINSFEEKDSHFVKNALRIGEINKYQALLQQILPIWFAKLLQLNTFNLVPLNNLGDQFKTILKQRKQSGLKYNDLSEMLQEAVNTGKVNLTEDELIGNITLAFFGGTDTTSNFISQMFYFLSEYPEVQKKLYNEIVKELSDDIGYVKLTQNPYLEAVVNEVLRLGNGVLSLHRTAAVDTKIGDIEVEKGTEIRLIIYIPHISSDKYLDPRAFNPDRFMKDSAVANKEGVGLFMPFGLGPKQCLGMRLAIVETKYFMVRVLKKYEIVKAKNPCLRFQSVRDASFLQQLKIVLKKRDQSE